MVLTYRHALFSFGAFFFALLLMLAMYGLKSDAVAASSLVATREFNPVIAKNVASQYSPSSQSVDFGDAVNRDLLSLEYAADDIWKSSIFVTSHNGPIIKYCGRASSGLALKPGIFYDYCGDGSTIIPASYQLDGRCVVHYDSSDPERVDSILAHEIGHCMYFIYGEQSAMKAEYIAIRPEVISLSEHQQREVFADDFMTCRHNVSSTWSEGGYYDSLSVPHPSQRQCRVMIKLFEAYFPL